MVRGGARAQRSSSGWRTRAPIHTLIETYHRRRAPPHPTGAICTVLTESGARSFRPANNLLQPSKGNPPLFNANEGVCASERNAQQYNNPNQILTPHRDGGELAEAMHWRCSRAIVLLKHRSRSSCPATLFAAKALKSHVWYYHFSVRFVPFIIAQFIMSTCSLFIFVSNQTLFKYMCVVLSVHVRLLICSYGFSPEKYLTLTAPLSAIKPFTDTHASLPSLIVKY